MAYDDPLETKSIRHWEGSVHDAFQNIPGRIWRRIRAHYSANPANPMSDLTGFMSSRYSRLEPSQLPKTIRDVLGSLLADEDKDVKAGKYERSPGHDREPYDKDGGYDRQGFPR